MIDHAVSAPRSALRPALTGLLLCIALTLLAIGFVDRPVASFAHAELGQPIFITLQRLPEFFPPLALLVFVAFGVTLALGRSFGPAGMVLLRCSLGLVAAIAIKDQLKYAFGRTWPETWTNNNPSFIGNGTFGFFPFHGGQGWFSFPSGHTTVMCAVAASLWLLWPRFRILYALAVAIVVVGLIGADFHWVSDILAGGFLGTACGIAAARAGRGGSA